MVANYQQALAEIDKKLPEVALIDVKLSNTENNEGLKLLHHINKNKDIPVIIISGLQILKWPQFIEIGCI